MDFPSYDAADTSSLASSSTASGDLKKAIQWLASSTTAEVPEEIKQILDDGGMQSLKDEQTSLNKRKKLAAKLERLKRARTQKQAQWAAYKEKMALRLREEQDKFDREQADLSKSIQETQNAIDRFGEEDEGPPEDPETFLQDPEKILLAKELEQAKNQNQQTMQQLAEMQRQQILMQQQIQAYAAATSSKTPMVIPEEPAAAEAREAVKKARQERMRKVEDQMKLDAARERSPRRESQNSDIVDSQDMEKLG